MIHLLFVCLGNICRSPMAEAILDNLAKQAGVSVRCDSCGTASYHIGARPDQRTLKVLKNKGIETPHRARQIQMEDFDTFDYVIAMDHSNARHLNHMYQKAVQPKAKLLMMGEFFDDFDGKSPEEAPDPYYGHLSDFEALYDLLASSCENLLAEVSK